METSLIFAALLPYLSTAFTKGIEGFAGEAGKNLWAAIKAPFLDKKAIEIIKKFEESPSLNAEIMASLINQKMHEDSVYKECVNNELSIVSLQSATHVTQHGEKSVSIITNHGPITFN